ncbi:guanosine-3',5'-bis(diphosphate) 3'-pyrophosphohydrolase MESH1 [Phlebotomus argentipes]|uniref:guanosine-3',5'-bis(diphosphate) 3'-pyrophosphohydrolase MESH1 n=1 Tax=Phlebotomus argentipes TaxID=94469 RepID=UPI002892E1ED|nr:guanosine-3',5'-bis(diphosphate) 3'-pyrophosphohydrolase MESH1 [Phlebotomus argentipes]
MSSMEESLKMYTKCVNFAAVKHKDQRRKDKDGTPYINHPVGVAYILTDEAGIWDLPVLLAAILHDTVEDTETTFEEIEEHFGTQVRNVVAEVTDDKTLPKDVRKAKQIENAAKSSYEARLVKLADKLYNLRDLQRCLPVGWTDGRRKEYFRWAKAVVDNLRGTNAILEEALDVIFRCEKLI